ncbi:MAG: hypothetical protein ACRDPW_02600 [Mycobacteriales bacterium]
MSTGITFDAGALIAVERRSGRMQALLDEAAKNKVSISVPAGALGQAWRGGTRQARLAKLLRSDQVSVVALDELRARAAGVLCGQTGTSDLIDASVVLCAREQDGDGGGTVVTSDADAIKQLDANLTVYEV